MHTSTTLAALPLLVVAACASAQDVASSFPARPIRFALSRLGLQPSLKADERRYHHTERLV